VEDVGFEARLLGSGDASTMRLCIGGMTCASCSTAVETALKAINGIHVISVSLITTTAEVSTVHPIALLGIQAECQAPLINHCV